MADLEHQGWLNPLEPLAIQKNNIKKLRTAENIKNIYQPFSSEVVGVWDMTLTDPEFATADRQ